MCGDDDGTAPGLQLCQEIRHDLSSQDIQTVGGLVKDNHCRVVDQRNGQRGLLLHAGGEIGHLHLCKFSNAKDIKQLFLPLIPDLRGYAVQFRRKSRIGSWG